ADGHDGEVRLAGAGRQHDHAAPAGIPPRGHAFTLVRKRVATRSQGERGLVPGAGVVLERDLAAPEMFDDGPVVPALGAMRVRARIMADVWQSFETLRIGSADEKSSAVEVEMYRHRIHADIIMGRSTRRHLNRS